MNKDSLLKDILVKHRQLERYLFAFVKDSHGAFVATNKPKFSREEMLQPGVVGDGSLKDLLCHLIAEEQRFVQTYQAGEGEKQKAASLGFCDDLSSPENEIPSALRGLSLEDVLALFPGSFQDVFSTAKTIPEDELFLTGTDLQTGQATLAAFLAGCTCERYDWAKEKIRRWRRAHAGKHLNKNELLERIQTERRRLEKTLSGLNEEQYSEAGVVGEWSVKDLLAHLFDWEQRFEAWYDAGLQGEVPQIPAPGLRWSELDTLNRQIYEKHRHRDLEDIKAEFHNSYERVLAKIKAMPEDEIFEVARYAWLGKGNLAGYILANTANHYRWAKMMIQRWLKNRGP